MDMTPRGRDIGLSTVRVFLCMRGGLRVGIFRLVSCLKWVHFLELIRNVYSMLDSPRIYMTSNPWRLSSSFKAISTTQEEYTAVVENLKSTLPPLKKGQRRPRNDGLQLTLIENLEKRVEEIDHELAVSSNSSFPSCSPVLSDGVSGWPRSARSLNKPGC